MAKKGFNYKITDVISVIKENENSGWSKSVIKVKYDGHPEFIDVRKVDLNTEKIGSGISFTHEECDKLADALIQSGYGSTDVLLKECKRRSISIGADLCPTNFVNPVEVSYDE